MGGDAEVELFGDGVYVGVVRAPVDAAVVAEGGFLDQIVFKNGLGQRQVLERLPGVVRRNPGESPPLVVVVELVREALQFGRHVGRAGRTICR